MDATKLLKELIQQSLDTLEKWQTQDRARLEDWPNDYEKLEIKRSLVTRETDIVMMKKIQRFVEEEMK